VIVVDASIVVEVLLRSDAGAALEERLFEGDDPLHAPHLLDVEVAHALRRCALRGDIDERHGRDSFGDLTAMSLSFRTRARHVEACVTDLAEEAADILAAASA
jgi:predicted nucleic acid-binding protein